MAGGLAQLEWAPELLTAPVAIDPLRYPVEPGLLAARGRTFGGLHGFLADSLPDGWGHLLMRRRLRKLGLELETLTPLERLALVGRQGRGALIFEPQTTPREVSGGLDLDDLALASIDILRGEEASLADTLADLAGASGGARPKVHVGFGPGDEISVSYGESAADHESWIVKFPATTDPADIGPIEIAYASMAQRAGLALSACRLLPSRQGPGYFATRRFDRPAPGRRLHMLSLAGVLEADPTLPASYDIFLRATLAITRHAEDLTAAFRRMVFNILACNRDDHLRQHSYLMDDKGAWRLAPAYDLTYSTGPGGEHYLDIEGEGRRPTRAHVEALGQRHGFSWVVIGKIIDEVRAAVADWPTLAAAAGVSAGSRADILGALVRVDRDFG